MVSQSQRWSSASGSATEVVHPAFELGRISTPIKPVSAKQPQRVLGPEPCSGSELRSGEDANMETSLNPTIATERWNESQSNIFRIAASFFCFIVMGANDAAYGPLIPYLETYYDLSYAVMSLVFLSPFVGYVSSAILNNHLHQKLGQRGVALTCGLCHTVAYTIIALHPPYAVVVMAFMLAGFAGGVASAAWNAWVGNLANSSELLGFLHASYGAGGVASPLIATSLIAKSGLQWYTFYYLMIGLAVIETITLGFAFWGSSGAEYRRIHKTNDTEREIGLRTVLFHKPGARVTWVAAFFLFCYAGVEVGLGGWIVVFMLRVRHGEPFASGMTAVGFWLGITLGRAVLGFVTPRLGLKLSTALYIGLAGVLELVFWLVPQFYVSAVSVSFQGFFLGPLFPNIVLVASRILPRQYHVIVIGFATAFSGCGSAVLPFLTGFLSQSQGPQVLQPVVLSLLVIMVFIWLCFPRTDRKRE